MKVSLLFLASVTLLAGVSGAVVQQAIDHAAIVHAQQNEMQANGLEDECKSTLNASKRIRTDFEEQANGDYRLSIYGGRAMVCEEQFVTIIRQPDALEPIVIECKHP